MGQKPRPSQPRHVSFRRLRTLVRTSTPLVKPSKLGSVRPAMLLAELAEAAPASPTNAFRARFPAPIPLIFPPRWNRGVGRLCRNGALTADAACLMCASWNTRTTTPSTSGLIRN
jgi:hypothetical protein